VKIHLPYPPSVNSLYPGKARRYKSEKYKKWISEATAEFFDQYPGWLVAPVPTITGAVQVNYRFGRPDQRKRDLANLEKAVSDFLVLVQVIEDDCLIVKLTLEWAPVSSVGCYINVEQEPLDDLERLQNSVPKMSDELQSRATCD
jgi:crossover junction endodeoxyribonuclease RusA